MFRIDLAACRVAYLREWLVMDSSVNGITPQSVW
jgi:hypothetical protein